MSEALQKMVEAMIGEFQRQIDSDWQSHPVGGPVEGETIVYCDGHFDMEQVARAGLVALRDADGGALVEIILAGADVPDSVQRFWPKMLDFILRE